MADGKKKKGAKGCLLGCLGVIVFFGLIGACTGMFGDNDKQETKVEQQTKKNAKTAKNEAPAAPKATEQAPQKLDQYMVYAINKSVGSKTNHTKANLKKRVRSVSVGSTSVLVELIANDNLSNNLIRTGVLMDSVKIFQKVFTERKDVPKLVLKWEFPLQDAYGNERIGPIISITMTKETAAKINWNNFMTSNLPKVADNYLESTVLKK